MGSDRRPPVGLSIVGSTGRDDHARGAADSKASYLARGDALRPTSFSQKGLTLLGGPPRRRVVNFLHLDQNRVTGFCYVSMSTPLRVFAPSSIPASDCRGQAWWTTTSIPPT